jgi:hypothetical protein
MAVSGGHGEAVGGGAVGARHARRRGREAAVGTRVRRGTAWRSAGAWQPCSNGTVIGGPGAGSGG